jgi:short-chain fatty acids transporter
VGIRSNPFARLGIRVRRGFGRVVPDPFFVAIALTVVVMVAAVMAGRAPLDVVRDWSRPTGLWALLVFAMQMSLMLVLGTALAEAPAVRRGLARLVGASRSPRRLVGLVALVALVLALINWSLGIIGGALVAREAGRHARIRGWTLHYPLICAAGYSGLMAWHGGLSGSAPLKGTTMGDMVEVLGPDLAEQVGTIPLSASLFSPLNLWVCGGLLVLGPLVFMALTPAEGTDPSARSAPDDALLPERLEGGEAPPTTIVEAVERSPLVLWVLAAPMVVALGAYVLDHGVVQLDFNTVNLALWCAAMVLHGRPRAFLRACETGIRGCTGIVLQFPLYAGIMGVMSGAGLSQALTEAMTAAGSGIFVLVAFASAGLLNLLVPSGGGQWTVQGPILMAGALELGLDPAHAMMAMAYGDQWTNMLQPFWALPLLSITGVRARDIIGYTSLWMLVGGAWMMSMLWWGP